ncbi:AraC family transcriptional regulator [Bradyrhizobium sp. sGM-13]|uniref:helix-turn-helix transcriptional regulator n=1 Tax=Bradyrhizobium sp. sGM-13 TaxID=2831781 RepID=UPI001BCC4D41|nr:AraC family transcriptional regulator [Bradyrhizobium sp. sGM-13]
MAGSHESLSETHIVGDHTNQSMVRAEECLALAQRQIAHVGVGDAAVPYKVVRTHLSGTYVHASLGGEGRILLDGRWRPHQAGMVSLAPAHVLHAFHAIPSKRWQYCWVRYLPTSPRSSIRFMAPVMAQFDPQPLNHAILGFMREFHAGSNTSSAMLWIDLIEHYISRFAEPLQREDRLRAVWEAVQTDLAHPWTIEKLAAEAKISGEHLRRLCQQSLGRSPMQQLTYLRVQFAAHRLAMTGEKIEDIAQQVGYQNPFAFSNTFKRMTGFRPSQFQTRMGARKTADML